MRSRLVGRILISLCLTHGALVSAQTPRLTVDVADTTQLVGVDAVVPFTVSADSPVLWRLELTSLSGGGPVVVDSIPSLVRDGVLRLEPMSGDRPAFPSGGYWVDVIGVSSTGVASRVRFAAILETPPLTLAPLPDRGDLLLVDVGRSKPPLGLSIAAGVIVAGGTILAGRAIRPTSLKAVDGSESSRPVTVGVSLGVLTGLASRFLVGRPDREAEDANRAALADFEQRQTLVESSNAFVRSSYRGLVILRREVP